MFILFPSRQAYTSVSSMPNMAPEIAIRRGNANL
jgi:hypothetical protein